MKAGALALETNILIADTSQVTTSANALRKRTPYATIDNVGRAGLFQARSKIIMIKWSCLRPS
jgi:hypothetical protein